MISGARLIEPASTASLDSTQSAPNTAFEDEPRSSTSFQSAKPELKKSGKSNGAKVFTCLLCILLLILSTLATKLTSKITLQGEETLDVFTEALAPSLEAMAVVRARSLVPGTEWLKTDEETDSTIRQYIEENAGNSIRSSAESLARDSNLAWIIRYGGNEYSHNWKDSYNQTDGALDYTIRSSAGGITYSGAIQPDVSFSRARSILVNPALVPEERRNSPSGCEYAYSLVLPDDFSIHYYVPKTLQPNGGVVARVAADVNQTGFDFCRLYGSIVVVLFVLLFRYRLEEGLPLLTQLSRMKALFAILVLGGMYAILSPGLNRVTMNFANGSLKAQYLSFAMNDWQAELVAWATVILLWFLVFMTVALIALYIKRIFKMGPAAFVEQDSLCYWGYVHAKDWILESFSSQNRHMPVFRLTILSALWIVLTGAFMLLGVLFFDLFGLIAAVLISCLIAILFAVGIAKAISQDFQHVLDASHSLAMGNYSEFKPEKAGMFNPIVSDLVHIAGNYENARNEGLASQVSKSQLISNVSHDLKTPVAGIQSYSELISMSDNMDDIHHYASHLQNYSARLASLIEDLFDITKATSGDIVLDLVHIDLCELVEQVQAEWIDTLAEKHLETIMNLDGPVMIDLDPNKMVRVIDNLFSNIRKYSLPGSRVFITLINRGSSCELIFRNTSADILDFDPEQIMERFVRGDASRHEAGSGLGLAIIKSFVEVQNGDFIIQTDGDIFKAIMSFPLDPAENIPLADSKEKTAVHAAPGKAEQASAAEPSAQNGEAVDDVYVQEEPASPSVLEEELTVKEPAPKKPSSLEETMQASSKPETATVPLPETKTEEIRTSKTTNPVSVNPETDPLLLASITSLQKEGWLSADSKKKNEENAPGYSDGK